MGMTGKFVALPTEVFSALRSDPAALDEYLYPEDGDDPDQVHSECDFFDVQKLWHGIHFLLTGTPSEAPPPLGLVVLGGQECGADTGYGPPRFLEPRQVREVATALDHFPVDDVAAKYRPADLDAVKVYPSNWVQVPGRLREAVGALKDVIAFYREAAEQGKVVIKYID